MVVLSALNNFMVVNLGIVSEAVAAADNVLNFGLMGSIEVELEKHANVLFFCRNSKVPPLVHSQRWD